MEKVLEVYRKDDADRRIPVLRLEIDYELLNLHDAMLDEDLEKMEGCKRKLEELRKELLLLEAYRSGGKKWSVRKK